MTTSTRTTILDPTVQPVPESASLARRPSSLEGATVGLLANGKRNSQDLLRAVYTLLGDIYHFEGSVELTKPDISRPAPKEQTDQLLKECDVVLVAIGD